jgi:hypothetical protein
MLTVGTILRAPANHGFLHRANRLCTQASVQLAAWRRFRIRALTLYTQTPACSRRLVRSSPVRATPGRPFAL